MSKLTSQRNLGFFTIDRTLTLGMKFNFKVKSIWSIDLRNTQTQNIISIPIITSSTVNLHKYKNINPKIEMRTGPNWTSFVVKMELAKNDNLQYGTYEDHWTIILENDNYQVCVGKFEVRY